MLSQSSQQLEQLEQLEQLQQSDSQLSVTLSPQPITTNMNKSVNGFVTDLYSGSEKKIDNEGTNMIFTKLERQNAYSFLDESMFEKKTKSVEKTLLDVPNPSPLKRQISCHNLLKKTNRHEKLEKKIDQVLDHVFVLAHGTNNLKGIPIHTIVTFPGKSGYLIASSLHLKNLTYINTNPKSILRFASESLEPEMFREISSEVDELRYMYKTLTDNPKLQRSISSLVAKVAAQTKTIKSTKKQSQREKNTYFQE